MITTIDFYFFWLPLHVGRNYTAVVHSDLSVFSFSLNVTLLSILKRGAFCFFPLMFCLWMRSLAPCEQVRSQWWCLKCCVGMNSSLFYLLKRIYTVKSTLYIEYNSNIQSYVYLILLYNFFFSIVFWGYCGFPQPSASSFVYDDTDNKVNLQYF